MTFHDWLVDSKRRFEQEPPATAARESTRAFARGIFRRLGRYFGTTIWEKPDGWDVLVVLDACRHDLMLEVAPEYDRITTVDSTWSNASCSIDWMLRNFNAYPIHSQNSGYITGNPFAHHTAEDARSAELSSDDFAYFAPLYKTEWGRIKDGPVEAIPPDILTDYAISAWRRRSQFDMDRMIIHYMQPHQPYRSRPDWTGVNKNLKNLVENRTKAGACAWQRCRKGEIDKDELWDAYRDNLRWVLDDVAERLLPNIDGTVVLTADHGNAMGEWGEWAHPPGAIGPAVRKVPWCPVECVDERTVHPDVDLFSDVTIDADTDAQLEALGYV